MKKKLLLSLAAIVLVFTIWAAFNREKFTQMVVDLGMAITSSVKHRDPSKEKAKFEVTAENFAKAFKENAADATKQYINQAVLVEGTVTGISGVTISLNNIACNMDSTQFDKIKTIQTGNKIRLQGLVVGYNDLMEEVSMAQCTIK